MKLKILSIAAVVTLAGCATRPSEIAPSYVSTGSYKAFSCEELQQEAEIVSSRALIATGAQEKAAGQDAAVTTVGIILFWPALFFNKGDGATAAELARLKGEMEAIETVSRQNGCDIVFQRG